MIMLLPGTLAKKKTTFNHAKETVCLENKRTKQKSLGVLIASIHSEEEAAL